MQERVGMVVPLIPGAAPIIMAVRLSEAATSMTRMRAGKFKIAEEAEIKNVNQKLKPKRFRQKMLIIRLIQLKNRNVVCMESCIAV